MLVSLAYLPTSWKQVNFDKRIGVAIVIPWGQVAGLEHMDNQISQLFVIVYLKLSIQMKSCQSIIIIIKQKNIYLLFLISQFHLFDLRVTKADSFVMAIKVASLSFTV